MKITFMTEKSCKKFYLPDKEMSRANGLDYHLDLRAWKVRKYEFDSFVILIGRSMKAFRQWVMRWLALQLTCGRVNRPLLSIGIRKKVGVRNYVVYTYKFQ